MKNNLHTISPSTAASRIALLDIFRGFALLGIFVVNIRYMSSSVLHPEAFTWMKEGTWNQVMEWILNNFFNGKFYPIFSFLFGVGFGMQINKMEEKGSFSNFFFLRRYFFLMLFGVLHVVLLWGGDVLVLYALAGFLVLLLRKVPVKYILILTALILIFPLYGHIYNFLNSFLLESGCKPLSYLHNYDYSDIVGINTTGSFTDNLRFRLYEYTVYYRNVEYFPALLTMIFSGYVAGRYKFYNKIPGTLKKLTPVAIAGFVGVILFRIIHVKSIDLIHQSFKIYVIFSKLLIISNITQAFLYLYIISFLYEKGIFIKFLQQIAFAGRTSLTNYMMQSVAGLILFNGMFFGLYGKFGLAWLGIISLVIYVLFIIGSKYWLSKFRYGPLEFIWRELTYKTSLKFIKNGNNNTEK
jgi:uncharacterized protein